MLLFCFDVAFGGSIVDFDADFVVVIFDAVFDVTLVGFDVVVNVFAIVLCCFSYCLIMIPANNLSTTYGEQSSDSLSLHSILLFQ